MSHAKAQSRYERRKENQIFSLLSLRLCVKQNLLTHYPEWAENLGVSMKVLLGRIVIATSEGDL